MKQLDYDSSNYKHKEDIKILVSSINELADKYIKNFENSDGDLKKVNTNIDKKNASIEKLDASLLDLSNKTNELGALKELSNSEIKELNEKKSTISYTDSEVQKMELDDINSQIAAKKSKITKIDAKIDATKAKIKAGNEEKKTSQKELQELEKTRLQEEEALFRTQSLVSLVQEIKDEMNTRALDIVNAPYKPTVEEPKIEVQEPTRDIKSVFEAISESELDEPVLEPTIEEVVEETTVQIPEIDEEDVSILDFDINNPVEEIPLENTQETVVSDDDDADGEDEIDLVLGNSTTAPIEKVEEPKEISNFDSLLEDKFKKEGLNVQDFSDFARDRMTANRDSVIKNMDILKKHGIPLEYTIDQPEIYYDITSQDLDDLLSIITTDDEGNGMGFTIDFTFNILTELSKINVDKLIDVYNNEFMNVNAKSGIIHLLKLTNPSLTEFDKNRRANIDILRSLGANTVDEIVQKHPEFVNMDNPLFVNVLNVFDKKDLVDKLNTDVDVVTKIVDYWRNN